MEIILTLFYAFLFGFIILKSNFFKGMVFPPRVFAGVFILKICIGFVLYLIYTIHYQDRAATDIFKYFDDSYYMTEALWNKPADFFKMLFGYKNDSTYFNEMYYDKMNNWFRAYKSSMYNDSHAIIRFNAVVRIFSLGYYHVHTVFFCFLSLIGLTALYKAILLEYKAKQKLLFLVIFLLPSVLLWGSGVLKEGLMFFGLGFLILSLFHINRSKGKNIHYWLLFIVGLMLLLFQVKFYVLAAFLTGIIAFSIVKQTRFKSIWLSYLIAFIAVVILGLNFHYILPEFKIIDLLVLKQKDFIELALTEEAGSYFEVTRLAPNFWSLIKTIPEALINSLFRPFPWDASGLLLIVACLENIFVFIILLLSLIFYKKPTKETLNTVLFFFSAGILLMLIVGWTTPVSGALVRYKIPGVIGLLIAAVLVFDQKRACQYFKQKIKKGNK